MPSESDSAAAKVCASPQQPADDSVTQPWIIVGVAGVIGLATFLFFFHLGTYGLWEPDEARYAEIAREMLASLNLIVPHLNYVPYIEKPPLLYWLTTLSMSVLGINEFAARFINALAALYGVAATIFFTAKTFDIRRAILAGAVLCTSAIYAVMAQVLTTDMLLTAIMATAMYALFLHWREGGRWCWLAYVAMGFAVLTKGPVGVVIPVLAGTIFLWREGELRGAISRFHLIAGAFVTAAIALPWFVAITISEPGFFDFYFIGEHFRRFFDSNYSHGQPIYYYVPIVIGGLVPWTFAIPFIPWRSLTPNPVRRFCVIASATILILFSLSSAKLVPYILPAIPPVAILIADGLATLMERRSISDARRLAGVGPLIALSGIAAIVIAMRAPAFRAPYPMMVRPVIYAAGAILIVGGVGCFAAFWTRRGLIGVVTIVLTAAAVLTGFSYGRLMAEPIRSYAQLAREIERVAPDARLVCYPRYVQSLPFYCRRRVILVGGKTELAFGSEHSPDATDYFFITRADLIKLWKDPRPTVFIVDRFALDAIKPIIGDYKVIASDQKKVAIAPVSTTSPEHQSRYPDLRLMQLAAPASRPNHPARDFQNVGSPYTIETMLGDSR